MRVDLDVLLEADGHHGAPDLLHLGVREREEVAVLDQRAHLAALVLVTDADDRNMAGLDQRYQLLQQQRINNHTLPLVQQTNTC